MAQEFYINFQKTDGTSGTYGPVFADSESEARSIVGARNLPYMNNWTGFSVSTTSPPPQLQQQTIDQPTKMPDVHRYGDAWYIGPGERQGENGPYDTAEQAQAALQAKTAQPAAESTGSPDYDALLSQFPALLQQILSAGFKVNPAVSIGPEQIAEFTKIAESEINPFYANQLKTAREGFLTQQGYNIEDIQLLEQNLSKKYGEQLRQIGEAAAERGLARSGIRELAEQESAEDITQELSLARRGVQREATGLASRFAQQYGTRNLPTSPNIPFYKATPGQRTIGTTGESPLYQLSQDVYRDLTGSKEFEQRAALRARRSELAGLTRELGGIEAARSFYI